MSYVGWRRGPHRAINRSQQVYQFGIFPIKHSPICNFRKIEMPNPNSTLLYIFPCEIITKPNFNCFHHQTHLFFNFPFFFFSLAQLFLDVLYINRPIAFTTNYVQFQKGTKITIPNALGLLFFSL